ncbi:unnamed protein product [Caenorhabditis nigoni]
MGWFDYIPVLGAAKGAVQCLMGDTSEGVQALKDSVKIPAIAAVFVAGAVGGAAMDQADGEINLEERADGAKGLVLIAGEIWNWGK